MRQILCITSSPRRDTSYSNLVAARVLKELSVVHPDATVTIRDLARNPLPHIDHDFVTATRSVAGPRTDRQQALLDQSNILVDELIGADALIIAAAMINFGIPSTLKAWFDFVARPGVTFRQTPSGSQGLLKGRRAILVLARGGFYSSSALSAQAHDEAYLRTMLKFLGITDIETILVEGVALGADAAQRGLDAALRRAGAVAGVLAAAA